MIKHTFSLSILSAAGLVGMGTFFLDPQGITKAAKKAHSLGFGIQILPLQMLPWSEPLHRFLDKAYDSGININSYEGRWGGNDWKHPLRFWQDWKGLIAYYLLFPLWHKEVGELTCLIHKYFPEALGIDLTDGKICEVSPNTNPDPDYWVDLAKQGTKLVIDTHHLHQKWKLLDGYGLLERLLKEGADIAAVQVQFREEEDLYCLINDDLKSHTYKTLLLLRYYLSHNTPVIIELAPSITTEQNLMCIRDTIRRILD